MKISLIVAMAENHVIGRENGMPWKIPGELARFKQITTGHPIIMGRKTFESIGRPLPNRLNIVITRDNNFYSEGIVVVNSLNKAIDDAKKSLEPTVKKQELRNETVPLDSKFLFHDSDEQEIFIIGGGQIFKEAISLADKLYLTLIHKDIEGDTFFPEYETLFTKVVSREDKQTDEYAYSFLELEKE